MMMTATPAGNENPVLGALDELIASYDRALRAFRSYGLEAEAEALLPDRELLVVLRSRLGFLNQPEPPA